MKSVPLICFWLFVSLTSLLAQVPSSCFEIESILVDACGNPEGENEMVRFRVGPNPLNTSSLTVAWPNNPWLGICQNATTTTKVAQLNSTITACGLIKEPANGVLPAGAQVILITSTNFITAANSFAQLTDTIYLIFQCAGNTGGHFANATGSGSRTLTMSFGAGCSDVVTYSCQQLVDINGNTGLGGSSTDRDGSTANFTWGGTASYVNYGCSAPYVPQVVNAGPDVNACQGDTLTLNGTVSGNFSAIHWSGGSGTWINPNAANAQYVVGLGDVGTISLQLSATNCNGTVSDAMNIVISNLPQVSLTPSGTISICTGDTLILDAGAGGPYTWNTGHTGPTLNVSTPGTYIVSATNGCGTYSDTAIITTGTIPVASIQPNANLSLCPGNTLVLQASAGVNYLWNTGATSPSITITTGGTYWVIVSNGCGSDTASVNVADSTAPSVLILNNPNLQVCDGDVVVLTATGEGTVKWPGWSADSIYQPVASGIYVAVAYNSCGIDSAQVQVTFNPLPFISLADSFMLCSGNTVQLYPQFEGTVTWSNGVTADTQGFSSGGNYFAVATNICGSDTAFFSIHEVTVHAGFSADSLQGASPLQVNFTNTSTGANAYSWNFGNGDTSDVTNPTYIFYLPGEHLVILSAINTAGCSDTASITIAVKPCDNKTFIPNAFTPNQDEVNPLFKVNSTCFLNGKITIFDRWGKEITSWTDPSQGWSGNDTNGTPYPMGVYVYMFEYNDVNGDSFVYRGQLNLIR